MKLSSRKTEQPLLKLPPLGHVTTGGQSTWRGVTLLCVGSKLNWRALAGSGGCATHSEVVRSLAPRGTGRVPEG